MAERFPQSPHNQPRQSTSRPGEAPTATTGAFSWWSWRPGIAPLRALLAGLPLMLLASLLLIVGLYTLILGILGGASPHTQLRGALPGSSLLLLIGAVMLPYPLFLIYGGWHDLRGEQRSMTGRVVALRTTAPDILRQGRPAHPGVTPHMARAWYGVALLPPEPPEPSRPLEAAERSHGPVVVFRLGEELYRDLREGELVRVVYTAHLHHVQSLRKVDAF